MNEFRNTSGEVRTVSMSLSERPPFWFSPSWTALSDTMDFDLSRAARHAKPLSGSQPPEQEVKPIGRIGQTFERPKLSRGQEIAERIKQNLPAVFDTISRFAPFDENTRHTGNVPAFLFAIASAIDAAIAEERERCAKAVEAWPQIMDGRFVLSTRIRSPE
jgi:hypothetical protein